MQEYSPERDYKKLHIDWLREKKGFRPRGGNPLPQLYKSYIEYMIAMYYGNDASIKENYTAYIYLRDDYNFSKNSKTILNEVAEMFGDVVQNDNPSYFVTFSWSKDNFNPTHAATAVQRLFSKSWIDKAEGVFEYYGLEGDHPHFHCVLQTNKYKKIYDFRKKMLESSLAKGLAPNFVDVKPAKAAHMDYVDGDKCPAKKECLEKDIIFRNENNLQHKYVKLV